MTLYGKKSDTPGLTKNPRGSISSTRGVYKAPPPPNLHEHSAEESNSGLGTWKRNEHGAWEFTPSGGPGEGAGWGSVNAGNEGWQGAIIFDGGSEEVEDMGTVKDASFLHALDSPPTSGEDTDLTNSYLQPSNTDPDAESSSGAVANPYGEPSISDNSSAGGNIVVLKQTAPGGKPPISLPDEEISISEIAINLLGGTGLSYLRPEILAVFRSASQAVKATSDVPLESERDMLTLRMRQGDVAHADVSRCMGQLAQYKYDTTTTEGKAWYDNYGQTDSWLYVFWKKMLGKVDTVTDDANVLLDILRKFREVEKVFALARMDKDSNPYKDTYVSKLNLVIGRRHDSSTNEDHPEGHMATHSPIGVLEENGFAPINLSDGVTSTQVFMQLINDLGLGAHDFSFPFMEMAQSSDQWTDARQFKDGMYLGKGDDGTQYRPHMARYCNLGRLAGEAYRISSRDTMMDAVSRVPNSPYPKHTSKFRKMHVAWTHGRASRESMVSRVALTCMLLTKELAVSACSGWLNKIKDDLPNSWKSRDLGASSGEEWKDYFQEMLGTPRNGLSGIDHLRIGKVGNNLMTTKTAGNMWEKSKLTDFLCIDLQDQGAQHTSGYNAARVLPLEDRPVEGSVVYDDARFWFNQMISPSQKGGIVGFFDTTAINKYRENLLRTAIDSTSFVRFLLDYPNRQECEQYEDFSFGDVDMGSDWEGPQETDHTDHLLPHMVFYRFLDRMQKQLADFVGKSGKINFALGFQKCDEGYYWQQQITDIDETIGNVSGASWLPTFPFSFAEAVTGQAALAMGWMPFWLGAKYGNGNYKVQLFSLLLMSRDRRNYDRARGTKQFYGKFAEEVTLKQLKEEGMPENSSGWNAEHYGWTGPMEATMENWELTPSMAVLGNLGYSSGGGPDFRAWITEGLTGAFGGPPGSDESEEIVYDVARRMTVYFGKADKESNNGMGSNKFQASYQAQAYAKNEVKASQIQLLESAGYRGLSLNTVMARGIINLSEEWDYRDYGVHLESGYYEFGGNFSRSDYTTNHYGHRLLQMLRGERTSASSNADHANAAWVFADILEFVEELQQLAGARSCRDNKGNSKNYTTNIPGSGVYGDQQHYYTTRWHNLGQDFFLAQAFEMYWHFIGNCIPMGVSKTAEDGHADIDVHWGEGFLISNPEAIRQLILYIEMIKDLLKNNKSSLDSINNIPGGSTFVDLYFKGVGHFTDYAGEDSSVITALRQDVVKNAHDFGWDWMLETALALLADYNANNLLCAHIEAYGRTVYSAIGDFNDTWLPSKALYSNQQKASIKLSSMAGSDGVDPYTPPIGGGANLRDNDLPALAGALKGLDELQAGLRIYKLEEDQTIRSGKAGNRWGDYRAYTDHQWKDSDSEFRGTNELLLTALTNELALKDNTNIRIMAVGLPAGMVSHLRRSPVHYKKASGEPEETNSVVRISITRISHLYPGLVFHPVQFDFNVSVFLGSDFGEGYGFNPAVLDKTIEDIVPLIKYKMVDPHAGTQQGGVIRHFYGDDLWCASSWTVDSYSYLWNKSPVFRSWMRLRGTDPDGADRHGDPASSDGQRLNKQLLQNHVFDYAMKLRMRILYGLDFDERTFFAEGWKFLNDTFVETQTIVFFDNWINATLSLTDQDTIQQKFKYLPIPRDGENYLFAPRSGFKVAPYWKKPDEDKPGIFPIVPSQCRVGDASDLKGAIKFKKLTLPELRMLRMVCASPVMAPNFHAQRLFQPNIFDRVFLVPVDIDNFLIDKDKSGHTGNAYQNLVTSGIIDIDTTTEDARLNIDQREGQEVFMLDQFIVQSELLTGN